jgi:hypothetical protein
MHCNFDLNELVKKIRIPKLDFVLINFMKELKYIKSKDNKNKNNNDCSFIRLTSSPKLLIILSDKENMLRISSAYKPDSTMGLNNGVPHWGTTLSTDYLSFL